MQDLSTIPFNPSGMGEKFNKAFYTPREPEAVEYLMEAETEEGEEEQQ